MELPQEVVDAIQAGRKIEAVKIYRAMTGASLVDAKSVVEQYGSPSGSHSAAAPRQFEESGGAGSLLNVIVLVAVVVAVFWFLS